MAALDLSNGSNSSDAVQNPTAGWLISLAVLELFLSGFCLFMVIYLSIKLKKGAWDSPAKRFGQMFNVYFTVTFIFFTAGNFMIAFNFKYGFSLNYIGFSLFYISFVYFTVIYAALSLQISTPLLPENLKLSVQKIHCVRITEGSLHVFFLLLLISFITVLNYDLNSAFWVFLCYISNLWILFITFHFVFSFPYFFACFSYKVL